MNMYIANAEVRPNKHVEYSGNILDLIALYFALK